MSTGGWDVLVRMANNLTTSFTIYTCSLCHLIRVACAITTITWGFFLLQRHRVFRFVPMPVWNRKWLYIFWCWSPRRNHDKFHNNHNNDNHDNHNNSHSHQPRTHWRLVILIHRLFGTKPQPELPSLTLWEQFSITLSWKSKHFC